MPTRIAGIQPGYLPWLGYFDQMRRVDVFVIADEMQFSSSGWAHRNRVRGPHGAHWLTLPARPRFGQPICDVALDPAVPWTTKHLTTLRHFYGRSPHAPRLLAALQQVLVQAATRLVDATIPAIRFLAGRLGITTPLVVSSEAGLERRYRERFPDAVDPTHRIIAFVQALGGDVLLSSETAREYLDLPLCEAHGVRVEFGRYEHPVYPQLREPFVSHLSAVDLLMCAGEDDARHILRTGP